ncbi:MAG: peptidase T [Lewinellaceae bacterium]|nr:peptidase T [Lewinellaceae bacterium]
MKYTVKDRFLKYVQVDTQADPMSSTFPSSAKQKDLTKILCDELDQMGISYQTNDAGYIYAFLPKNVQSASKKIFFCAHIDTAPDCSGTNVKPIVHKAYDGKDIKLPDDSDQVISPKDYPTLNDKIGKDIITASGLTLLGSDDKSGVAIIMDALHQLTQNPELKHGDVRALITTDEEIGKGVANVELSVLDADFGYTLDAGNLGSFEYENFSANGLTITFTGKSAHPGYAKDKMENSIKIASAFVDALPKDTMTPETSDGKMGFIHPTKIEGGLEESKVHFILRDFSTPQLDAYKALIENTAKNVLKNFPHSSYKVEVREQYRNMRDVIDKHPHVIDLALKAMERVGITPDVGSIRGGTDGAVLSHKGLPCPNLFAGMQAIHSKHEWVCVQDMEKGVDTVLSICALAAEM